MDPVPPISGIQDPSKARVMLYQVGQPVHAALDSVGLLTEGTAAATYLPLTGGTLSGPLTVTGTVTSSNGEFISSTTSANLAATGAGGIFLRPNGIGSAVGLLSISSAGHTICASLRSLGTLTCDGGFTSTGLITPGYGFAGKRGIGGATSNVFNYFWNSVAMEQWVDTTNTGTVNVTSDYRIKKDVADLGSTWNLVKALRPISYSQAEFQPPMSEEMAASLPPAEVESREAKPSLFVNDDNERWGFIAHEIQETLLETAASGYKDMEDGVQALNLAPILAAAVRALQEAMSRIEALENKP